MHGISEIVQKHSALAVESSPVKLFSDQKIANEREPGQFLAMQDDQQSDRYKDFMQIGNYIPNDNNDNCDCGHCSRCMNKFAEQNYSSTGHKNSNSDKSKEVSSEKKLSPEDQDKIQQMKKRDIEVRTHEQAHVSAGAKNAQYEYVTGPDGKRYANGGHADIETSKSDTPEGTLTKAEQIKRAALAPANPSSQDRKVAAEAEAMIAEARKELQSKNIQKDPAEIKEKQPTSSKAAQNSDDENKRESFEGIKRSDNSSIDETAMSLTKDQFSVLAPFSSSQLKDITQNYSRLSNLKSEKKVLIGDFLNITA